MEHSELMADFREMNKKVEEEGYERENMVREGEEVSSTCKSSEDGLDSY